MCGLFGVFRCPTAAHPQRAAQAFAMLGVLTEERGRDAAGIALAPQHAAAGMVANG